MISMLASGAVDRGFEPRSGQTKDYKTGNKVNKNTEAWNGHVEMFISESRGH
jgi:hypothetical protein